MDQPTEHIVPIYGATIQYAKDVDTSMKLGPVDTKFIQQVTGTFLYYARSVDATMLVALSAITSDQSAPTAKKWQKRSNFLIMSQLTLMRFSRTAQATW